MPKVFNSEKFKVMCGKSGFSYSALARKISMAPSAVAQWARGIYSPSKEAMEKVCQALECSPEDLSMDFPRRRVGLLMRTKPDHTGAHPQWIVDGEVTHRETPTKQDCFHYESEGISDEVWPIIELCYLLSTYPGEIRNIKPLQWPILSFLRQFPSTCNLFEKDIDFTEKVDSWIKENQATFPHSVLEAARVQLDEERRYNEETARNMSDPIYVAEINAELEVYCKSHGVPFVPFKVSSPPSSKP